MLQRIPDLLASILDIVRDILSAVRNRIAYGLRVVRYGLGRVDDSVLVFDDVETNVSAFEHVVKTVESGLDARCEPGTFVGEELSCLETD